MERSTSCATNLLGLNRQGLEQWFEARGEKRFRASQVLKWIHQHGASDFAQMTNLSKALRERLTSDAEIVAPRVVDDQRSQDGTRKWLLGIDAHNCVEMVFIPEPGRGTLCVSSQVGCALNCRFCSTAQQGFNRNLTTAEIIGQVRLAHELITETTDGARTITNIVLMGMGEPLLNFDRVTAAIDIMLDDFAYCFAKRRVTLSTAGVVPGIRKLKARCPVSLAVSLHAPDDELRDELVPINRKYPLDMLLDACWDYVADDGRQKVTFEYVMLDGINDTVAHAKHLAARLRGHQAKVNLIPFNPFPNSGYVRSTERAINAFRDVLVRSDIITITRKTRGDDIDAACGQLAGQVRPRSVRVATRRGVSQAQSVAPPLGVHRSLRA